MKTQKPAGPFQRLSKWLYFAGEYYVMGLVPKDSPGPIFLWFFKYPILYYRLGLGWMIGKQVLLLTTIGRKTGKKRFTPLGYRFDPDENIYYLTAGWDGRTDWYRNLQAGPQAHVQVGSLAFDCQAEFPPFEKRVQLLSQYNRDNPFAARLYERETGQPFDGSPEALQQAAVHYPSVALRAPRPTHT